MAKSKIPQAEADMSAAVSKSSETAFYLASRGVFSILPGAAHPFDAMNLNGTGGNPQRAQLNGESAIKKDPSCGLGHLAIAMSHVRNGDLDAALKWAQSAYGASPKLVAAYELAHWIIFSKQGKKSPGLAVLDRGLQEAPTSPRLLALRGKARKDQSELDGAIVDFTDLIRVAPNEPEGYRLRADCYTRHGDSALAAEDYRRAEALKKEHSAAVSPSAKK